MKNEEPERNRFSPLAYLEVKTLPIAFITFFAAVGFASLLSFISSYTSGRGLAIGGQFFFLSYAVFTVISRPVTGKLFDLKGANFVMVPAFIFYALGLVLLAWAPNSLCVLLAGALIGLGFGTYMSCSQAIVIKVSPVNHMGLANSTFFIFMDLGVGLGPLLLGQVILSLGFSSMYAMMAIVVVICLGLYYVLHGRKSSRMRRAAEMEKLSLANE
ncbi:MFS transporter [Breoghania sp.]|uniref:MFS transporter n=1 Tax=Breoghania sp. TaxID=2065378 RepID=UPI002631250E|nr:MFS transporter [Breoghania sp.]MDJ0932230.1 MFS transporter [Breoghania sp.]